MMTTITFNPKGQVGYQWVLRRVDEFGVTRICFDSKQAAEQYLILKSLYNEPI